MFIEEFAVKKDFRRKGFGTALLHKLFNFCKKKNISSVHLGTNDSEDNLAINYYEKLGFKKVGFLEDIDPNSTYEHSQVFYAMLVKDWFNNTQSSSNQK